MPFTESQTYSAFWPVRTNDHSSVTIFQVFPRLKKLICRLKLYTAQFSSKINLQYSQIWPPKNKSHDLEPRLNSSQSRENWGELNNHYAPLSPSPSGDWRECFFRLNAFSFTFWLFLSYNIISQGLNYQIGFHNSEGGQFSFMTSQMKSTQLL